MDHCPERAALARASKRATGSCMRKALKLKAKAAAVGSSAFLSPCSVRDGAQSNWRL